MSLRVFEKYYKSGMKNNQIESKRFNKDGELCGPDRAWYKSGQIRYENFWKDGKKDGLFRSWHENGKIAYEQFWKNGKEHGPCMLWYENGRSICENYYWEGLKITKKKYKNKLISYRDLLERIKYILKE